MALSILGGMMLTPHDQFWFALACLITIVAFAIVDAINKQGVQHGQG